MERTLITPIDPWQHIASVTRWFVVSTALVLPLATWFAAIGSPFTYVHYDLPPGQVPYILAKLAGLYAFVLLWLQVMFGLLKNDPLSRYLLPQWSVNKHRLLGVTTLLTAWTHFLLFFAAVSLRKDAIAYDLLIPEFEKGIYFFAVSLGWFAVIGMTLVAVTGILRNKTHGIWSLTRRLSLGVFIVALVHAQMIGSEAKGGIWLSIHLLFAAAVLVAIIRKFALQKRVSVRD
jgi:hypothetical protein